MPRRGLLVLSILAAALLAACGEEEDDAEQKSAPPAATSGTLSAGGGETTFAVDFKGAKKTTGEIRRAGQVTEAPADSSWWGFEITVKNISKSGEAKAPQLGVVCSETAVDSDLPWGPGFIMGQPPYNPGMTIGAGGAVDGIVPFAVPDDAEDCRFVVQLDEVYSDASEPLTFSFR